MTETVATLEQSIRAAMAADDWTAVADLAHELDAATPAKPLPALVNSALYYASVGLRVFPLQAGLKIPHKGTRGCLDASSDPDQILTWWRRWPQSNVGIATGHLVDVIDIDGPIGVQSWARLYDNLPTILGVVNTPRHGGSHYYVPATGDGNKAGMFPGVDYRGAGGYVVAPPSVNAEGVAYRWRRPLTLEAVVA